MSSLSSLLSWFEGESASVAWATLGGCIVAAGLAIEKIAEWLDDRFLGEYKAHKKMELIGWWILMFGICIEIADAGMTAHEIKKTESNVANLDPINRPVVTLSANVDLDLDGTNFVETTPDMHRVAVLMLCKTNLQEELSEGPVFLVADGLNRTLLVFPPDPQIYGHGYVISFHEDPLRIASPSFLNGKTVSELLNDVNSVRIYVRCVPHNAKVNGGSADLLINGTIHKRFWIRDRTVLGENNGGLGKGINDDGFTVVADQ